MAPHSRPEPPAGSAGGVAVLAVGVRPERIGDHDAEVVGLPVPGAADQAGPIFDAIRGAVAGGHGIAVFPEWLGEEALARVESARAASGGARVAIFPTSLPPLAGGVLAGLAAALADRMPPGALLAALRRLETVLRVFAWVGSVARLPDPRPGPLQRLGSLLPSGGFIVSSWPEPSVRHIRRRWDAPRLAGEAAVLVAAKEGAERLLGPLSGVLSGAPRREVAPTPLGPAWWGTSRLVEAVAYPTALAELGARLETEIALDSCRWCGEWIASDPCPFCGSAREG